LGGFQKRQLKILAQLVVQQQHQAHIAQQWVTLRLLLDLGELLSGITLLHLATPQLRLVVQHKHLQMLP
jgi:hypothetical protein